MLIQTENVGANITKKKHATQCNNIIDYIESKVRSVTRSFFFLLKSMKIFTPLARRKLMFYLLNIFVLDLHVYLF